MLLATLPVPLESEAVSASDRGIKRAMLPRMPRSTSFQGSRKTSTDPWQEQQLQTCLGQLPAASLASFLRLVRRAAATMGRSVLLFGGRGWGSLGGSRKRYRNEEAHHRFHVEKSSSIR